MQDLVFFQSAKFKSFTRIYAHPSVNMGNQELSVVNLSICGLLLIYATIIFNGTVKNFEKIKFPVFLSVKKNVISVIL